MAERKRPNFIMLILVVVIAAAAVHYSAVLTCFSLSPGNF